MRFQVAERGGANGKPAQLMLNLGQLLPMKVPFNPNVVDFSAVEFPKKLRLDSYLKLL